MLCSDGVVAHLGGGDEINPVCVRRALLQRCRFERLRKIAAPRGVGNDRVGVGKSAYRRVEEVQMANYKDVGSDRAPNVVFNQRQQVVL